MTMGESSSSSSPVAADEIADRVITYHIGEVTWFVPTVGVEV
jgi:hypothetical protein